MQTSGNTQQLKANVVLTYYNKLYHTPKRNNSTIFYSTIKYNKNLTFPADTK